VKRIYHHWTKWECYKAGFFGSSLPEGIVKEEAESQYAEFLSDIELFTYSMECVINEWPNSCDQFLSNASMNRIAWLGQSSMCLYSGVPSRYKSGFRLMSDDKQNNANLAAKKILERWIKDREG